MKVGMILGIIGGVIALIVGAVGFSLSSLAGTTSTAVGYAQGATTMEFYKWSSIVLPIAGIIGSGMVFRNRNVAMGLMVASAVGIVFVFGLGLMSIVPAGLLAVGALLIAMESPTRA